MAVPLESLYEVDALVMWAANHSAVVHKVRSLRHDLSLVSRPHTDFYKTLYRP